METIITNFLVIGCVDKGFRGEEAVDSIRKFLNSFVKLKGKPHTLNFPGITHKLVNFSKKTSEEIWQYIIKFIKETETEIVVIHHHEDCWAYKLTFGLLSPKKQKEKNIADMRKAKRIIEKNCPGVQVILIYSYLVNSKERKFAHMQIS